MNQPTVRRQIDIAGPASSRPNPSSRPCPSRSSSTAWLPPMRSTAPTCRRHQSATASASPVSSTSLMPPWNADGTRVSSAAVTAAGNVSVRCPAVPACRAPDRAPRADQQQRRLAQHAAPERKLLGNARLPRMRRKPLRPAPERRAPRGSDTARPIAIAATPPPGPAPGSATTPRPPPDDGSQATDARHAPPRRRTTPPAPSRRPPDRAGPPRGRRRGISARSGRRVQTPRIHPPQTCPAATAPGGSIASRQPSAAIRRSSRSRSAS